LGRGVFLHKQRVIIRFRIKNNNRTPTRAEWSETGSQHTRITVSYFFVDHIETWIQLINVGRVVSIISNRVTLMYTWQTVNTIKLNTFRRHLFAKSFVFFMFRACSKLESTAKNTELRSKSFSQNANLKQLPTATLAFPEVSEPDWTPGVLSVYILYVYSLKQSRHLTDPSGHYSNYDTSNLYSC